MREGAAAAMPDRPGGAAARRRMPVRPLPLLLPLALLPAACDLLRPDPTSSGIALPSRLRAADAAAAVRWPDPDWWRLGIQQVDQRVGLLFGEGEGDGGMPVREDFVHAAPQLQRVGCAFADGQGGILADRFGEGDGVLGVEHGASRKASNRGALAASPRFAVLLTVRRGQHPRAATGLVVCGPFSPTRLPATWTGQVASRRLSVST